MIPPLYLYDVFVAKIKNKGVYFSPEIKNGNRLTKILNNAIMLMADWWSACEVR